MPVRKMKVERRIFGTVDGAEEFHCRYTVGSDVDGLVANFTLAEAIAAAGGSPSEATILAVVGALQAHGRALAGTGGTNDERATIETADAVTFTLKFRDVPSSGLGPPPVEYTIADVIADPGAPSQGDFDAVIAFFLDYGDSAAGYVP